CRQEPRGLVSTSVGSDPGARTLTEQSRLDLPERVCQGIGEIRLDVALGCTGLLFRRLGPDRIACVSGAGSVARTVRNWPVPSATARGLSRPPIGISRHAVSVLRLSPDPQPEALFRQG